MTVEAFVPSPVYVIAGVGPYGVTHPYREGALRLAVWRNGIRTELLPADFTVSPVDAAVSGTVTLSAAAAATHAGGSLFITRETSPEQGWEGTTSRERGLEAQLDWITEGVQDIQQMVGRALITPSDEGLNLALPPAASRAMKTLMFDASGQPTVGSIAAPDVLVSAFAETLLVAANAPAAQAVLSNHLPGYTRQQLLAVSVPPAITSILTTGYAALADHGGAFYVRAASEPSHAGKFQSADGAWWELRMPYVTPEMFGAKGDDPGNGTGTDDRTAFQNALNFSRRLILARNATYRINGGLTVPRFQQIIGLGTRSNTDIWSAAQTGAARLIFTGTGTACFANQDTGTMLSHGCMKGFIIRCIGTYGWMIDFNSALDWLFMHLGMETPNLNTGGIRSVKIPPGTGPSWVNKMFDVSVRLPDLSSGRVVDVDWSDSLVEACHLTGGTGCVDKGFGVRWLNNQIERSSYAGLTIRKQTNVKTTTVIGNLFDINKSHSIAFDASADPTTDRVFHTVVNGNVFRTADPNTSAAGGSSIVLLNPTGFSYRVGPITGNQELHPGVPQLVETGTWTKPSNLGNLQA
jgi:hypothetical protein